MLSRQIALLCSVAILASLFLPWIITPLGTNHAPWNALPAFASEEMEAYVRNASPQVLVFLASFVLAAFFLFLALIGREKRIIALVTGALPVGLAVWTVWQARAQINLTEIEGTMADANRLFAQASEVLGPGGWAWIGGATLLFLLGLFDPGRARARPITTSSRW